MTLSVAAGSGVARGGTFGPVGPGGTERGGRGLFERDRRAPAGPGGCWRTAGGLGRLGGARARGRAGRGAVRPQRRRGSGQVVRRLRRLGVDRALARAGARDGDEITVGAMSFTWGEVGDRRRQGRLVLLSDETVNRLCGELASACAAGHTLVVVSSGAISAGWDALDRGRRRPSDPAVLQAVSAVGQHRLMRMWQDGFEPHGVLAGQVLLAPLDFVHRTQYLHARGRCVTWPIWVSSRW